MAVKDIGNDELAPGTVDARIPALTSSEVIEQLRRPLEATATACFQRALKKTGKALFREAERTQSPGTQQALFDAMRVLRQQAQPMNQRFRSVLADILDGGFQDVWQTTLSRGDDTTWKILDRDEVEEEVAIEGAISRLRHQHSGALEELRSRLSHVASTEDNGDDNPFDPTALLRAFNEALQKADMGATVHVLAYRAFEKQLNASLGTLYTDLNRQLDDAGLTAPANRRVTVRSSDETGSADTSHEPQRTPVTQPDAGTAPARESGQSRATQQEATTAAPTVAEQLPREDELAQVLHELVAVTRSTDDATGVAAGVESGETADAETVARTLSAVQLPRAQTSADPIEPTQLKKALADGLQDSGNPTQLDRSVDQTIDIVSMLFEVILEDERLPGEIETEFSRLQVPVLRIAITDGAFLSDSSHPARQLFNTLARAALSIAGNDNVADNPIYRNIRAAVEKTVTEFNNDASVFGSALEAFEEWQWQTGHGAVKDGSGQGNQRESRQARAHAVRHAASEALEYRLDVNPHVPETVAHFLRDGWSRVLFITGVKQGIDSDEWCKQLQIVDSLIWSTTPHDDETIRDYVAAELPALLQRVQDGLNHAMYSPKAINDFLHELKDAQQRVNGASAPTEGYGDEPANDTGATHDLPETLAPTIQRLGGDSDSGVTAEPQEPAENQIVNRLKSTPVCSWFDIRQQDGTRQRVCLQARVDGGQRFIFADRQGSRVAEYDVDELAADLEKGTAVPVETSALFDRAIENVFVRLKQEAEERKAG